MDEKGSIPYKNPHLSRFADIMGNIRPQQRVVPSTQEAGKGWRASPIGKRSIVNTFWADPRKTDVLRNYHTGLSMLQTIRISNDRLENARKIYEDNKLILQYINSFNMCLTKLGYCGKFYNHDGSHFCYCESKCKIAPHMLNIALEMFVISCFSIHIKSGDPVTIEDDGSVFIPKGSELPLDQLHLAQFIVKSLGSKASYSILLNRKIMTPEQLFFFAQRYCVDIIKFSLVNVIKSSGLKIALGILMVLRPLTVTLGTLSLQPGYNFEPP